MDYFFDCTVGAYLVCHAVSHEQQLIFLRKIYATGFIVGFVHVFHSFLVHIRVFVCKNACKRVVFGCQR